MDVVADHRWAWCPSCRQLEWTHFVRCLCRNYANGEYEDCELVVMIDVPERFLVVIDAASHIGGWDAAQAIAETWEVCDVRGGRSADRGGASAGVLLPT